jgi:RNA-directed DNA polymerase
MTNPNNSRYHSFSIPKGNGKFRKITAPDSDLKASQNDFLRSVLYSVEPHNCAHGFVPGRSIATNASYHVGKEVVLNVDIKDFFGSTKRSAVERVLERFYGLTGSDLTDKADLVCRFGELPQGAPTSPHLANLALYDFDCWLQSRCDELGLTYTRYADDLTISGHSIPKGFVLEIAKNLGKYRYRIADGKVHFTRQHQRQQVTGLVVNKKLQLPRSLRRWIRAVLHSGGENGLETMLEKSSKDLEQIMGIIGLQALYDQDLAGQHIKQLQSINSKSTVR